MKSIKISMNATTLRMVMIAAIILMTLGAIVGFSVFRQSMMDSINDSQLDSNVTDASKMTAQQTQTLKTKIAKLKGTSDKLPALTLTSQNYKDEVTKDLNKYAQLSGVSISGDIGFARPATPVVSSQLRFGSVTSMPAVVTLSNPVQISNYLKFIKLIEDNSPLMQLAGISISQSQDSKTEIVSEPIIIEVLTR